jgi:hypothetical protein
MKGKTGEYHYEAGFRGCVGHEYGRPQNEKNTFRNTTSGVFAGMCSSGDGTGNGGHQHISASDDRLFRTATGGGDT